jgi:hypothetical protein
MKRMLTIAGLITIGFLAGTLVVKATPQQEILAKVSCAVPKNQGEFKGMSGSIFIFEDPQSHTIKTLTCDQNGWHPQIQITRP